MVQNNRGMPLPKKEEVVEQEMEEVIEQPKVVKSKLIEVVALRPGFWKSNRKAEGEVFTIPDMSKIGNWMKLTDAKLEAERQKKILEAKKLASK